MPKLGKASLLTIDSTLADSSGTFLFERLPDGQYGIIGSQGDDACFQDSIQVVHGNGEAKPDTIRPTGAISGIVRLQAGDDSRTVLILIYGINSFSVPTDFIGDFSLSEIPYGTYRCRFLSQIAGYQPYDTTLTFIAGAAMILPDTIKLAYTAPGSDLPAVTACRQISRAI